MVLTRGDVFIFGLGFSARAWARRLAEGGYGVGGTCRSEAKRERLQQEGLRAWVWSGGGLEDEAALMAADGVLVSVPPAGAKAGSRASSTDAVWEAYGGVLAQKVQSGCWLGYLSTTGVYGDWAGAWVDEETRPVPTQERARARWAVEQRWQGIGAHIFRLAGIYGPGRNALERLRAGKGYGVDKPGQVFGRVHCEDIAQVLSVSMVRPCPGRIYNVTDDEPCALLEVLRYGAGLLGLPEPEAVGLEDERLSEMAQSFYGDNKRVRNTRMKVELGVELRYPSYREGLRALAAMTPLRESTTV